MSNFQITNAASDIAAAYSAVLAFAPTGLELTPTAMDQVAPHRIPMARTRLSKTVFGQGHPPREIPL